MHVEGYHSRCQLMKNTMADANVNAMLNSARSKYAKAFKCGQDKCIEIVDEVAQRIRHAPARTPT